MSASPPPPPPPPPPPGGAPGPPPWNVAPLPPTPGWGPSPPGGGGPGGPPGWGWHQQPALPGSGRFRAQAVGELLDSAFTLYRRNLRLILAITAIAQLPLALLRYVTFRLTDVAGAQTRLQQLSVNGTISSQQLSTFESTLLTIGLVFVGVLLLQSLVIQPIATAAMTRAVGDVYLEKPASVGSAYRAVGQRVGAVVAVALLLFGAGVAVVGVAVGVTVGLVAAAGSSGAVLLVLLLPLTIFVLILLYTRWLFAAPIVILERLGAVAAMRRSWGLVRGSTARVFGIVLLVGIITGILSAIVSSLLGVLTSVGNADVQLVLSQLASLIVSILIEPISFIVVVLLYYDVRIRREAFDIEMLAATL